MQLSTSLQVLRSGHAAPSLKGLFPKHYNKTQWQRQLCSSELEIRVLRPREEGKRWTSKSRTTSRWPFVVAPSTPSEYNRCRGFASLESPPDDPLLLSNFRIRPVESTMVAALRRYVSTQEPNNGEVLVFGRQAGVFAAALGADRAFLFANARTRLSF